MPRACSAQRLLAALATVLVLGAVATPQDDETPASDARAAEAKDEETASSEKGWEERLEVSEHEVVIGGVPVAYTATTGMLTLAKETGEARADLFFIAYTRTGTGDVARRPITFCFNGGPGSSSVWLHLGAYGPRRVPMPEAPVQPPPPYALVDNEHSLLDVTDLVFIDPVTTGYSRAAQGEDASQFHGVEEDIASVAEFIRLYTTRFERWGSPKFLSGESYGTTRAAGLARELQSRHGMYLNGIVLVSSILDFSTARFDPGNDEPYPLFLPTYAATAFFHRRLAPELQGDLGALVDEVTAFAMGDYRLALARGADLPAEEAAAIAGRLARYTGLSADFVLRANLRPRIGQFVKELRRDERLTVGRLDSRYTGRDRDAVGDSYEFDPSYAAIQGPYTAALNHYVRVELGFESDLPYEILTGRVHPWNYGNANRYVNTAEDLRAAMEQNPHLLVHVANGYYDLATPFHATESTFAHFAFEPSVRDRVSMSYYESGHMMYVHEPSLAAFKQQVAAFLTGAVPAR